jgi:hypothetical protein
MVDEKLPPCNFINEKNQSNKGQTIFPKDKKRKEELWKS